MDEVVVTVFMKGKEVISRDQLLLLSAEKLKEVGNQNILQV